MKLGRVKLGRPALDPAERLDTYTRLGMTTEMRAALTAAKVEHGIPASEFIRRAIQEKLDRMNIASR